MLVRKKTQQNRKTAITSMNLDMSITHRFDKVALASFEKRDLACCSASLSLQSKFCTRQSFVYDSQKGFVIFFYFLFFRDRIETIIHTRFEYKYEAIPFHQDQIIYHFDLHK